MMNPVEKRWTRCVFILVCLVIFCTGQVYSVETMKSTPPEESYIIGRGDILEITTWKEPDFSVPEITVRLDGKISFPLLNDIQALGRTPMQLKKTIEEKLKAYIEAPVVNVNMRNAASQKIYVLGEVVRTGEYNLSKELRVLQAFALAGGFTEWASKTEIVLLRQDGNAEKIIRIDYKNIIKGKDLEQNMLLKANDTIIVP